MTQVIEGGRQRQGVEEETLLASVVMPTHDRCELLARALDCLSRQTIDPSTFEVIVAVDGCRDGTMMMLQERSRPFPLRVLAREQGGSAAARNAAATIARAPVIVFLDDDIMAAPDLIERHLEAHRRGDHVVAIGRLAPAPLPEVPGWWRWLERQLEKQYREMCEGRRQPDGGCLYGGNCSMRRETFLAVGGFNEQLAHSEDVELGLRLERAGVRFLPALGASGEHWGYRTYPSWREMAHRYGRWDGAVALSDGVPSLARLGGSFWRRGRLTRLCIRGVCVSPLRLRLFTSVLRALAASTAVLRLRFLERSAYGAIYDLTYWRGVFEEMGSLRTVVSAEREAA